MISWVALSYSWNELALDDVRAQLDGIFQGHFLPPRGEREDSFVVEGAAPACQLLIKSVIEGASGIFELNSVPGPYRDFSDFAEHITDLPLRELAATTTCWMSVDLIHQITTEADAYRFIGKVLANFAPSDTMALVHPSQFAALRFNEDVRRELAAGLRPSA